MIWNSLIKGIKGLFRRREKREWFEKLVETLETKRKDNISIPFKIIDRKDRGFIVKTSGLYAFVPFNHMPWKYDDKESWVAIQPKLTNKTFFCKIYKISKDLLSIVINGEIPQFKNTQLEIGNEYKGLIVKKSNYGVFVDIGYHFDWKCGSFIGLLHKSQFDRNKSILNYSINDELQIIYQGLNEKGQFVLLYIVRNLEENKIMFLVDGKIQR